MKNWKLTLGATLATLVTLAPAILSATVLTSVPMQGGMVMPVLSYSEADGALHVELDPTVPQLTPLLVSNPLDSFEPADPWYDCLDPSRQGLSFSRRYGFVMGTLTDPLPANRAIWIRKLSGSPELSAYRYRSTVPKLWEPIFGTGGVTNALYWNGNMFHPAFTAPPGTNTFSATFEAYLLDTSTGLEVAGSSTGPFVFNWTDVPDGRPTLGTAVESAQVVVFWPATTTNYVLEATDSLNAPNWSTVSNTPVPWNDKYKAVRLEPGPALRAFRMRYDP
jgi:hypothetical protein